MLRAVALAVGVALCATVARAQDGVAKPGPGKSAADGAASVESGLSWQQIAGSRAIVLGRTQLAEGDGRRLREGWRGHVMLCVQVDSVLKGKCSRKTIEISLWVHGPSDAERLVRNDDTVCVIGFQPSRERILGDGSLRARALARPGSADAVRREVEVQQGLVKAFKSLEPPAGGEVDLAVRASIEDLVSRERKVVQAAVDALVKLGRPAVPAIIRRLADRRRMSVQALAFVSGEKPFQATTYHPATKVFDALATVLKEIGAGTFHFQYTGFEEDEDRDAAVAAWQVYYMRVCEPAPK